MENHIKVNLSSVQDKNNIKVNINTENKNHINTSLQQAGVNITKVEGEKDNIVVIGDYNRPADSGINIEDILTKGDPTIAEMIEDKIQTSEIIQNKADRAELPTLVSQLQNDVGYLTEHQDLSDYAKLSDIPINISAFENDVGYLTEHQSLDEYAKREELPTKTSELINDSGFLTEHQSLDEYAKKEELPTKTSELINDSGYLTEHQSLDAYATKEDLDEKADKSQLANYALKTELPVVPTNVSAFENDVGYLTEAELPPEYDDTEIKNRLNAIESKEDNWDAKQDALEPDVDYVTPDTLDSYVTTTQLDNAISAVEDEIPELPDWIEDTKPTYTYDEVGADPEGAANEVQENLDEHIEDDSIHVTSSDKVAWNGKVSDVKVNGVSVVSNTEAIITNIPASIVTGLSDVATSGQYADLNGTPEALPNPNSLKFGNTYYNGSESAEITAASIGAATESFVNSSIATNTAYFRGTYNITEDLGLDTDATDEEIADKLAGVITEVTNNDYTFVYYYAEIPVVINDNTPVDKYRRFKYDSSTSSWQYEYELNNSSFTDAQWKAITSGITSTLVTQIGTNSTAISNTNTTLSTHIADSTIHITANERSTWNAKQNALTAETDYITPSGLNSTLEDYATAEDLETVEGKIPTQASDIGAASASDLQTTATSLNNHIGNSNVHLQAGERAEWDSKVADIFISGQSVKDENNEVYINWIDASFIRGLSAVATSGSIEDIEDAPEKLPSPYALKFGNNSYDGSSEQTITAGTIGAATTQELANVESRIPTVPTNVSAFTNDAGYLTQHQSLAAYALKTEIPTVPTKVSAFTNDAGYLTQHQSLANYALKSEIPTVPTNVSAFTNDAGYLTQHQSLANYALKSEIPTVPTNVSAFTNDAGYLTSHQSLTEYIKKADAVEKNASSQQTISLSSGTSDTPLQIKSRATGCYLGFKDSSNAALGYYGVTSSHKPVFYYGSDKEIAIQNECNANTVDNYHVAKVSSLPTSPDSNTIYFIV